MCPVLEEWIVNSGLLSAKTTELQAPYIRKDTYDTSFSRAFYYLAHVSLLAGKGVPICPETRLLFNCHRYAALQL